MEKSSYNPDVLNCLANLSNDEVFTPPTVAAQMIDLLPQELFRSTETRFLDPFSKSGVFLREIVKRLDHGLQEAIPDRQQRIDHILHNQVFGIAITELTAHLSRRTLYCSKDASSKYSVSHFDNPEGNMLYTPLRHTWGNNDKCIYCGASRSVYDRGDAAEQYAYQFIHTDNPQKIFPNMKFDVIIGNPPYQLSDGGAQASAMPIYNLFVEQAKKLNPRFLCMIIPARWYSGGKGLDEFRDRMLKDGHIRVLYDFFDSNDCFPGIDLSGGVCYFLWDRDNKGDCFVSNTFNSHTVEMKRPLLDKNTLSFIRFNNAVTIVQKVHLNQVVSFSDLVSSRKPFGLTTTTRGDSIKKRDSVLLYSNKNASDGGVSYIGKSQILNNAKWIEKYKVFISYAYGERGSFPYLVIGKPFVGEPKTCCTETYLHIGPFKNREESENVISYMKTKMFRFLVLLLKNTQHATSSVYQLVPIQDFSHPWTDEMLYKKYGLEQKEIDFIESMIRPME